MESFIIKFLGCKVNSYEADALANSLLSKGLIECNDNNPTYIIINTCSVTHVSGAKSRKMVRFYRQKYRSAIIIVMGCESQFNSEEFKEIGANIILGTSYRDKILDFIDEYKKNNETIIKNDNFKDIKKYENLSVSHFLYNTRAYVKIQDGCNNFCSYCLIPYLRGRSRSRNKDLVIKEIQDLIKNGYKEIVLTGIDMCSYGLDLEPKTNFSNLLEEILIKCPSLYRLRISSIESSQIDDKFIDLLANYSNIANHLHIPLQSGSESILKRMNRKYDLDEYREKIRRIRLVRPDISITTDVIVGFVGETEENFMETYNFCKEIEYAKIHVFPYSVRKGTAAEKMKPMVNNDVKKERVHRLIDLSNSMQIEYNRQFKDQEMEFLFESFNKEANGYVGHSSNFLEFIKESEENLNGKILKEKYIFDSVKIENFE